MERVLPGAAGIPDPSSLARTGEGDPARARLSEQNSKRDRWGPPRCTSGVSVSSTATVMATTEHIPCFLSQLPTFILSPHAEGSFQNEPVVVTLIA